MSGLVQRLDDWGKPAWITAMVIGFVVFWPIGLLILFYLFRSGRMGCNATNQSWSEGKAAWMDRKIERMKDKMSHWQQVRERAFGGSAPSGFQPTGNAAFDEYRSETLRRLEDEAVEFRTFLERLRQAKDKAEFDQFMQSRRAPLDITPRNDGGMNQPG